MSSSTVFRMEYSELDTLRDTPLVAFTYSREAKATADMYAGGQPRKPRTTVAETMTFDVPAGASVEIRVSTDARGTLRRIAHHAAAASESAPAWSRREQNDYVIPSTVPWAAVSPPALTFTIAVDPKDEIVHVSVTDLQDPKAPVSDRFLKLAELRRPSAGG